MGIKHRTFENGKVINEVDLGDGIMVEPIKKDNSEAVQRLNSDITDMKNGIVELTERLQNEPDETQKAVIQNSIDELTTNISNAEQELSGLVQE